MHARTSESVLLTTKIKRCLAAFHYLLDSFADIGNVDSTFTRNLSARLIASLAILTPRNKLGIPIHNQIGIVANKYELSAPLGRPNLFHDFLHNRVIKVFFQLINQERWPNLVQERAQ